MRVVRLEKNVREERIPINYDVQAPEGAYATYAMRLTRGVAVPSGADMHVEYDPDVAKDVMVFTWIEYTPVMG